MKSLKFSAMQTCLSLSDRDKRGDPMNKHLTLYQRLLNLSPDVNQLHTSLISLHSLNNGVLLRREIDLCKDIKRRVFNIITIFNLLQNVNIFLRESNDKFV